MYRRSLPRRREGRGYQIANHEFRGELERLIVSWLKRPKHDLTTVRPATFLRAVRKIKSGATGLLDTLTGASARDDKESWAYEYAVIELGLAGAKLENQLRHLIETADICLEITPDDKGGRPTDLAFQILIERLASLYERQAGRSAGTSYDRVQGPFFRFVRECRDQFDLPLERQDNALGKAIYRCLKKRRQRLSQDKT
jgi:hypothetical protein